MKTSLKGLHPDLLASVVTHAMFGTMIDHPLLRDRNMELQWPDKASRVDRANRCYEEKKTLLEAARVSNDWTTFIDLHERPYRFEALCDVREILGWDFSDLWPVARYVWADSENIFQNLDEWTNIWATTCHRKHLAMRPSDRVALRKMPDLISVFRGVSKKKHVTGISWTTDRAQAEWFARRYASTSPLVASGLVRKSDVIAYFNERKENEIVVLPKDVISIEIVKLSQTGVVKE